MRNEVDAALRCSDESVDVKRERAAANWLYTRVVIAFGLGRGTTAMSLG